jgi:carbon storage regulator
MSYDDMDGPILTESRPRRCEMLVLSRKPGERIVIGDNVTITVVAVKGSVVRLAVQAPDDVRILRSELTFSQDDVDEPRDAVHPHFRATRSLPIQR